MQITQRVFIDVNSTVERPYIKLRVHVFNALVHAIHVRDMYAHVVTRRLTPTRLANRSSLTVAMTGGILVAGKPAQYCLPSMA